MKKNFLDRFKHSGPKQLAQAIHFVTYGDRKFAQSRERIAHEAKQLGVFSSIRIYTEKDRDRWFETAPEETKKVVAEKRGGGYWMWKPFCVSERLSEIENNDVIVYADSGCSIEPTPEAAQQLKNLIQQTLAHKSGMMRFANGCREKNWTKRDTYNRIYPQAFKQRRDIQLTGNRFIVVNQEQAIAQIKEWAEYAWNEPHLFDDTLSKAPNSPKFKQHRHDQSVFSLISKRRGCLRKQFKDINPVIQVTRVRQ